MFTDRWSRLYFFFNDTATTEIYTLSLHDALPIWLDRVQLVGVGRQPEHRQPRPGRDQLGHRGAGVGVQVVPDQHRSEEHTSELQSRQYLVCRLLLEKKNTIRTRAYTRQTHSGCAQ